jgi:hypothetical protein
MFGNQCDNRPAMISRSTDLALHNPVRFNWRMQVRAGLVWLVFVIAIDVCQADTSLLLNVFVVAPILLVSSILLAGYAVIGRNRSRCLTLLRMLIVFWTISTTFFVLDVKHPIAIRSAARWLIWSGYYKAQVLAQPAPNDGLRHIDWDGWGMFAQNTSVFLVFDSTDSLAAAAMNHQPGKFNGIPCEVPLVRRLESQWYSVQFYTGDDWGHCSN